MALRPLFATPIYEASLSTHAAFQNFNAELEAACRMLAAEDRAGQAWSKTQTNNNNTTNTTQTNQPTQTNKNGELKTKLDTHAKRFAGPRRGRRRARRRSVSRGCPASS